MSTKMKGLLKGLRYISQIFDEEPELQIGMPTDVKHVAHIGWDGPTTTNAPSWINQFRDEADSATAAPNADQRNGPRAWDPAQQLQERRASTGSNSSHESLPRHRSDKHKGIRWHSSSENSPRKSSTSEQSMRTKMLPPSPDSPARDSSSSTSKTSRRKKTKGSSSSSSSSKKSSKSKSNTHSVDSLPYSDPGIGGGGGGEGGGGAALKRSTTGCQSSVLKPFEEDHQKAMIDDKSRRI